MCRFVTAATQNKVVMLLSLMGPVTLAGTLGSPVLTIGIKRYTTEVSSSPSHASGISWYDPDLPQHIPSSGMELTTLL